MKTAMMMKRKMLRKQLSPCILTAAYCCAVRSYYSRNASVVMATAQQVNWQLAPKSELQLVAKTKSLVRILRGHNEVQAIVLNSISSMTIKSQGGAKMFQLT